tara:strand:+ start:1232 stop:1429 length:198 start_codon:yes stop_codon:yes gene_type:complete
MLTSILNWFKVWIVETGIEGWAGLIAGGFLWVAGMPLWAGVAFGFFACKNWEWIKNGVKSLFKKD